jgi:hypothetical protein
MAISRGVVPRKLAPEGLVAWLHRTLDMDRKAGNLANGG